MVCPLFLSCCVCWLRVVLCRVVLACLCSLFCVFGVVVVFFEGACLGFLCLCRGCVCFFVCVLPVLLFLFCVCYTLLCVSLCVFVCVGLSVFGFIIYI